MTNPSTATELFLWNMHTRSIIRFIPNDPECVYVYQCGPTIYDRLHIGNLRPWFVADTLIRVLQLLFPNVVWMRNVTDVDDKIIQRSILENISPEELTAKTLVHYQDLMRKSHIIIPTVQPKASEYIDAMIEMTQILIDKKHAYVTHLGNVFLDLSGLENYGMLSQQKDDLKIGVRVEMESDKKGARDFCLWKNVATEDVSTSTLLVWDSPWGMGRPGWHLECAAMIQSLTPEHRVDIHMGGHDLLFPHHENENILTKLTHQCCVSGYWVHNGLIQFDGEKMSKSLGNIIYGDDFLDKYPHAVLRYFFLQTHYRHDLGWSEDKIQKSQKTLKKFFAFMEPWWSNIVEQVAPSLTTYQTHIPLGWNFLCQDLNTGGMVALMHQCTSESSFENAYNLWLYGHILGLWTNDLNEAREGIFSNEDARVASISDEEIEVLIQERLAFKAAKDYKSADDVRSVLLNHGIVVHDHTDGTCHWSWME